MITIEQLNESFDKKASDLYNYLSKKNRGGKNNSRGNSFENYFTIFKIADFWMKSSKPNNIKFSAQVFCFIDDLVIEDLSGEIEKENYQIKDVLNLSWNGGKNSLKNDFKNQHLFYLNQRIHHNLYLVVSDLKLKENLKAVIPKEIGSFTKIVHFAKDTSINKLLTNNKEFKNKISSICAISNPNLDKLETVAVTLLGVWDASDKNLIPLDKIQEDCYRHPNYFIGSAGHISEKLVEILKGINNFSFEVENGFIKWRFKNTDTGILPLRVGTVEYIQWENDILNLIKLNNFEDLEPFL